MHGKWLDKKQVHKPFQTDTLSGWAAEENFWMAETTAILADQIQLR